MGATAYDIVPPDPAGRVESLSALGYTLESAISDLVDNSIDAGAGTIDLDVHWNGPAPYVSVADDGKGMTEAELQTAMAMAARGPRISRECSRAGAFRHGTQNRELRAGVAAVGLDTVDEEQVAERPGLGPRARRQFQRMATPARSRRGRGEDPCTGVGVRVRSGHGPRPRRV
jgi:Histidine kinase-, DNA gyrase B-, and HSP90-like ATPase